MFLDLANGIGPYLMGIVIGFMSFQQLYLSVAIWMFICLGLYYFIHGKNASVKRRALEENAIE
jgi:predicted MFS family arabinose efflux permease